MEVKDTQVIKDRRRSLLAHHTNTETSALIKSHAENLGKT